MNRFTCVALLSVVLAAAATEAADDNAAIVATAESYVAANSGMTKITVTVEQVADDFARVKVTPEDSKAADPAWVFLKKKDGKMERPHHRNFVYDRRLSAARDSQRAAGSIEVCRVTADYAANADLVESSFKKSVSGPSA